MRHTETYSLPFLLSWIILTQKKAQGATQKDMERKDMKTDTRRKEILCAKSEQTKTVFSTYVIKTPDERAVERVC